MELLHPLSKSDSSHEKQKEILAEPDPDLMDIAEDYLVRQKTALAEVEDLIVQQNDFLSVQNIGHKLRSNAVLFGLPWLAEKALALEQLAEAGQAEQSIELSRMMVQYLNLVRFVNPSSV